MGSATLAVQPKQQEELSREQGDWVDCAESGTGKSLIIEYPLMLVFFSLALTSILGWSCDI